MTPQNDTQPAGVAQQTPPFAPTTWGRFTLAWGARTYVMGILNITPDSFSLDGLLSEGASQDEIIRQAIAKGQQMVADGADLIDIGGESTRPATAGVEPLGAASERARVVPVIEALAATLPAHIPISIDTYKASVAAAALDAGAALVNDILGLQYDPEMAPLVAARGVPIVLMSNLRGVTRRVPARPVVDVTYRLTASLEHALDAGITWDRIILDPGIGFGLVGAENLHVLRELGALRALGRPLLVGTSRKSHIGLVLGAPVQDRLEGSAATVALSIAHGADIVRVHDVRAMARVARMSDAIVRGWQEERQ